MPVLNPFPPGNDDGGEVNGGDRRTAQKLRESAPSYMAQSIKSSTTL